MNNLLFNNRFIFQEIPSEEPTGAQKKMDALFNNKDTTAMNDSDEYKGIGSQRFNSEQIAEKTEGFEPSNNEKMFKQLKNTIDEYKLQKPDSDLETSVANEDITVENADSYTTTTYGYKMLYVNGKYLLYRQLVEEKVTPKTEDELKSEKSQDIADTIAWAEATAEEFLVDYEETEIAEVPKKYIKLPGPGKSSIGSETKPKSEGGETTYYVVCQGRHQDYYVYKSNQKKEGARI